MTNAEFIDRLDELIRESGEFSNITIEYGSFDDNNKFIKSDRDLKLQTDPREMVRIKDVDDEDDIRAVYVSVEMDNKVGVLYDIVEGLKQFGL